MHRINITSNDKVLCLNCGSNLSLIGNFKFVEIYKNSAREREELCECVVCQQRFIMHFNYFDMDGHIKNFVFGGDANDLNYNWQDQLTEIQKKEIEDHLKNCITCNNRLLNETTLDAWFASLIHKK